MNTSGLTLLANVQNLMANCPNCGSDHLSVAGGNLNACLECGTSWEAAELYQIRRIIQELTGASLDLARETDRYYMKAFMHEILSDFEAIPTVKSAAAKLITDAQSKKHDKTALMFIAGLPFGIGGCIGKGGGGGFLIFLIAVIAFTAFGRLLDQVEKKDVERDIKRAELKAEQMVAAAQENLQSKLDAFQQSYFL